MRQKLPYFRLAIVTALLFLAWSFVTAQDSLETLQFSQIAYTYNGDIFVINPDGTGIVNITRSSDLLEGSPAWSPDGKAIAFDANAIVANRLDDNIEIFVMDTNGGNAHQLTTDPAYDFSPAWSPDGKQIAFVSTRDGNREIYIINIDGSNERRLTDNLADDTAPTWSPDGRIIFATDRDGNYEVYVMDSDGSNATKLTNDPAEDTEPAWSPDGTLIAFVSRRSGSYQLYLMDADGSKQTRISAYFDDDWSPSWSPDSKHVVFERDVGVGGGELPDLVDLFIIDAYRTSSPELSPEVYQLTDSPNYKGRPAWSPWLEAPITEDTIIAEAPD
jgi:Tol biopolymer transport system component